MKVQVSYSITRQEEIEIDDKYQVINPTNPDYDVLTADELHSFLDAIFEEVSKKIDPRYNEIINISTEDGIMILEI